jgi:hypothetical protein
MNWTNFLSRSVTISLISLSSGIFINLLSVGPVYYSLFFINLGEIIIISSICYFLMKRTIYDVLFRNLGLNVNNSYPILHYRNGPDYWFNLPIGLSSNNFLAHLDAIMQYRGRTITINYEYDEGKRKGRIHLKELGKYGISYTGSNFDFGIVMLINIVAIIVTDYYLLG